MQEHRNSRLEIRGKFFTKMVVRDQNRLIWEMVESPSLRYLKDV